MDFNDEIDQTPILLYDHVIRNSTTDRNLLVDVMAVMAKKIYRDLLEDKIGKNRYARCMRIINHYGLPSCDAIPVKLPIEATCWNEIDEDGILLELLKSVGNETFDDVVFKNLVVCINEFIDLATKRTIESLEEELMIEWQQDLYVPPNYDIYQPNDLKSQLESLNFPSKQSNVQGNQNGQVNNPINCLKKGKIDRVPVPNNPIEPTAQEAIEQTQTPQGSNKKKKKKKKNKTTSKNLENYSNSNKAVDDGADDCTIVYANIVRTPINRVRNSTINLRWEKRDYSLINNLSTN